MPIQQSVTEGKVNGLIVTVLGQIGTESDDTGKEKRVIQADRTDAITYNNMPIQQSVTEGKVNGLIVTVLGQTGILRVMILGRRKGLYRVLELKKQHVITCLFSSQFLKVK